MCILWRTLWRKSWCGCSRLACGSQSANVKISIVVCAAPVPRLTLPSPTVGTGVVRIWCADLLFIVRLWPCGFGFLYQMSVFVLSCNIIMSLSILMYFFTVFEAAPLYSFLYKFHCKYVSLNWSSSGTRKFLSSV